MFSVLVRVAPVVQLDDEYGPLPYVHGCVVVKVIVRVGGDAETLKCHADTRSDVTSSKPPTVTAGNTEIRLVLDVLTKDAAAIRLYGQLGQQRRVARPLVEVLVSYSHTLQAC